MTAFGVKHSLNSGLSVIPAQILLLTTTLYSSGASGHLLNYDYYPGDDPQLPAEDPLLQGDQPVVVAHGQYKRETVDDIGSDGHQEAKLYYEDVATSAGDEDDLSATDDKNEGPATETTADLYGGPGLYSPYPFQQGSFIPPYSNPGLVAPSSITRPYYPYWGYSSIYNPYRQGNPARYYGQH